MHELSIAQSIVDAVTDKLALSPQSKVLKVSVRIGEYSGVETDALISAYPSAALSSPLEQSTLEIERVNATVRCNACGTAFPAADASCPQCGIVDFTLEHGMELDIVSFEVE